VAEPDVIRVMREHKQALLLREQEQMEQMAARWLQVENALGAELNLLARELADEQAAGRSISQAKLARMERYRSLLAQLNREVRQYAGYAEALISRQQLGWARLGIEHAAQAISASYPTVGAFFDRLPIEAIEHMVGMAGDGSPLAKLLQATFPDAAAGLTEALIKGTGLGRNPSVVAREMARGMAGSFNRMLTIARTEQLRPYREAARQQYIKSGVVEGFYRLSAHDSRVCAACLMSEGEFYELGETLRTHPNCRCTLLPKVRGLPATRWQQGADWFQDQDAERQKAILGPKRYQAWRDGKFDLDQLVTVKRSDEWGDSVTPTPLKDLV
jgi:SPP1 gp7 family putative phage head morphogenesis protein